jgi:NADPH:quinone reductase-like Zn-dependent oxidoreductase
MRAIVQQRYGAPEEVLALREIDRPTIKDDEVLVQVLAAPVAGDDWHLMRGWPYVARVATGLLRPKNSTPGRELAGRVEAVGRRVTQLRPGDEVFGWCDGGLAEYAAVPERSLAPKPANLTFEQAAAVPISALTALQGLRDQGEIEAGQNVLINGASGGVGTFAVQIARSFGAEVTGVCSTRNVELVRSLGAAHVIDYARGEDFTRGGRRYDLMLDLVGNRSLSDCRRALSPRGTLVMAAGTGGRWLKGTDRFIRGMVLSRFVRQRLRPLIHTDSRADLIFVKELIESGKVAPLVSARFALDAVPEAIRQLGDGHGRGKVVITI